MSSSQRPGTHPPGSAEFDAAEAAGLGDVTWADDTGAAAEPEAPGPIPTTADGPAHDGEGTAEPNVAFTVEDLLRDLERVTAERDEYLDTSRRLMADFENYKKAVAKREHDAKERANESLVSQILPVLDACDGALASGATDVEPVRATLIEVLVKQGLDRIDDADSPFDPERHDAVMHEPSEGAAGPVVAEVLRAGYSWKGRVVRPAMVRVRG